MDNPAAPIPSTSPQPEVSPTESPNRRWFLWLIGGLAVLVFGIAIGVFSAKFLSRSQSQSEPTLTPSPTLSPTPTPTPDPTADWKTYTNSSYKFSHKYPPDAVIEEIITQSEGNRKVLFAISISEIGATQKQNTEFYDGYDFTVVVVEKSPTESVGDISNENISNCKEIGELTKSPEKVINNGTTGITYSCRGLGEFTYMLLPTPKTDNQYFEIRAFSGGPNKTNYQKILNQVLSTFKFLDQNE